MSDAPARPPVVRYEVTGRVGVITLDRPERNNAWTGRVDAEYRRWLAEADADPEVRVILITGAGERFCVGGDSGALADHAERGGYDTGLRGDEATPGHGFDERFDQPFACHFGLSKPVIAAVNGAAAGIGMALACFCDVIFASEGAKFTVAHGKLGLPAEYGLSWMLPRMVGLPRAMDILMTSRVVTAEEAERIGMVLRVVPVDRLVDEALAYAEALAASVASQSLRVTRHQVYLDQHRDVGTSVAESKRLLDELMGTAEYREGVAALIEKRPPNF